MLAGLQLALVAAALLLVAWLVRALWGLPFGKGRGPASQQRPSPQQQRALATGVVPLGEAAASARDKSSGAEGSKGVESSPQKGQARGLEAGASALGPRMQCICTHLCMGLNLLTMTLHAVILQAKARVLASATPAVQRLRRGRNPRPHPFLGSAASRQLRMQDLARHPFQLQHRRPRQMQGHLWLLQLSWPALSQEPVVKRVRRPGPSRAATALAAATAQTAALPLQNGKSRSLKQVWAQQQPQGTQ